MLFWISCVHPYFILPRHILIKSVWDTKKKKKNLREPVSDRGYWDQWVNKKKTEFDLKQIQKLEDSKVNLIRGKFT